MGKRGNNQARRLAVVGGGAGGLACAIAAGERARELGVHLDIVVFERDDRVGRSILATGNGRCNFSNARIDAGAYCNAEFVGDALDACAHAAHRLWGFEANPADDDSRRNAALAVDFFERHGLLWREEADGRRFPQANKASVVLDVLRAAAANVGVREACERGVRVIEPPREPGKPFTLRMDDGVFERADAVVVACGGRALDSLEVAGVRCLPTRPVLGPLRVADRDIPLVRELDNIRVKCTVSLERRDGAGSDWTQVASEDGELMFRKYGVSGICVFNLSRFARPGDVVRVNFLAAETGEGEAARGMPARSRGVDQDRAAAFLEHRRSVLAAQFARDITWADMLRGMLLPRVYETLLKTIGKKPGSPFASGDAVELARLLTSFALEVKGIGDPDICQVRRGGLDVSAFDAATLESREFSGLYAVGEALDVDGPCGGFNLHWAWSTGILAGVSVTDALCGKHTATLPE